MCHPVRAHGWRRDQGSERKQHSRLSPIVEACCTSDDTNQCPGRYLALMLERKGGKLRSQFLPTLAPYLLLFALTGRSAKEPIMDLWDPLSFPHSAVKKPSGRSLFCQEASANQPIQVKTRPPLPVVLGWTQWGLLLLSIQC